MRKKLTNEDVDARLENRQIKRSEDIESAASYIKWKCMACGNEWSASVKKVATSGTGCPACSRLAGDIKRRKSVDDFIEQSTLIHQKKYTYDKVNYRDSHTKVIITCSAHGNFKQSPTSHLSGNGCRKCMGDKYRSNVKTFIDKSIQIHGNKYDYSKFVYKGSKIKGIIICAVHGEFLQMPNTHLAKSAGCPMCDKENRKGSYSLEYFEKNPNEKDKPGYLYVVRLYQHHTSFIKIGVAINVRNRLRYYYGMNRELLHTLPLTLFEAYKLEQHMLTQLKSHKFYTTNKFDGYTECVKDNQEVLKELKGLIVTS